jgi:hypothetical protein
MEHWLAEMGFSSIFSKSSHPGNPGQYSFGALGPGGAQTGAFYTNLGIGANFFTLGNIVADFWGKALRPFFTMLCQNDAFTYWNPGVGKGSGKNDGALAALNRFNSRWQQPLQLDASLDVDVASLISEQAGKAVGTPALIANQTLWDVLVGTFCREYLFYIVPRVEDAIAAPFCPGFNRPFARITTNTETQVEWMRGMGRPIKTVAVLSHIKSATGVTKPGQAADPELGIGGYFSPDPTAPGMIIVKQGPEWMNRVFAPAQYSYEATGANGQAIGTAINPGKKAEGKKGVADQVTQRIKGLYRPLLNQYAQALYAIEKLRPRQAVVSGPFRLDIGPGSTVLVENAGETFVAGDQLGAPFYAHVARVSLSVDGETPSIGTSFHLSHIRSEPENADPRTAVSKHPLYKFTFPGAPLVDF